MGSVDFGQIRYGRGINSSPCSRGPWQKTGYPGKVFLSNCMKKILTFFGLPVFNFNSGHVSTLIRKFWNHWGYKVHYSLETKHETYTFYCRNRTPSILRKISLFRFAPKKSFPEDTAGFFNFNSRFSTFIPLHARAHLEDSQTYLRTSWPSPVNTQSIFSTVSHRFQQKLVFFNFYSRIFNFYSARYQNTPGELGDHTYGRPCQLQWNVYRNFRHQVTIFNLK